MTSRYRIAVIGSITVVAFDVLAALASRAIGFRYSKAVILSFIIYGFFGYLAGKAALQRRIRAAAFVGTSLGLVDATLGWGLSWLIGPGQLKRELTFAGWFSVCLVVTATAAAFAVVGGIVARLTASTAVRPTV